MNCPKCSGKSRVLNSRNSSDPKNARHIPAKFDNLPKPLVYRDHKCLNCGETHQSIEIAAQDIFDLEESLLGRLKSTAINAIGSLGKSML